jgi:very-short-patch-repair endonuclease
MVLGVRELEDGKDAIEERTDGRGPSVDADPGPERAKIKQPRETPSRSAGSGSQSDHDRASLVPVLGRSRLLHLAGHRDERIAAIASLQRGLVSRQQLLAAGIGRGAIRRMLEHGRLWTEHQGVYSVGFPSRQPLARETAALLAVGTNAVLSHLSAAAAWGLCPARPDDASVEVLAPGFHTRQGIVAHRTARLEPQEVRICQGLPVTAPARTLRDIAANVSMRELERAVDEALVRRIVRLQQLRDAAARDKGRRGGAILTALLEHRGNPTITRSQAEERMLELLRAGNLPEPECNARVNGYEVDFLWRAQRLIVEVDGYAYHATRSAFERDRAKGAAMAAAGYLVIRITWLQMVHEPYVVLVHIAQAWARRS